MSNVLDLFVRIGELIAIYLDDVQEVEYSQESDDILYVIMKTGEKYGLIISAFPFE